MDHASTRRRAFIDPSWPYAVRMQARVLVGFSLFVGVTLLANTAHRAVLGQWFWCGVCLAFGLLSLSMPLLMRRTGSVALPATVLLSLSVGTIGLLALVDEDLSGSQSWWPPLYALMAVYLLGVRYGRWLVAVIGAIMVMDYIALQQGWLLFGPIPLANSSHAGMVTNWTALLLFGMLAYVYEVARRRSMTELADALLVSAQNERQLGSVLESTTAAICSVDGELRLLSFNQAFAALVQPAAAPPLQVGDRLSKYSAEPQVARWLPEFEAVLTGAGARRFEDGGGTEVVRRRESWVHPVALEGGDVVAATLFSVDIEDRKQAEEERQRLHHELMQASREAGMSSVAGEVLHTVGNVLNSVGVSATMMQVEVEGLRCASLEKAVSLMEAHADDLPGFLQRDPQGQRVLVLLRALGSHLAGQERRLRAEAAALKEGVEQLTRVLRAQQTHTHRAGSVEVCTAAALFDMAMSLQAPSWGQRGITVVRDVRAPVPIRTDRNRVIEILVNLIANARYALMGSDRSDRRLVLRADLVGEDWMRLVVEDNGVGIAPEVMPKLFELGFTTKADGTGLGLHAGANAARLLGGTLRCESEGLGQGARFILKLPLEAPGDAQAPGEARRRQPGPGEAG
ncbi:sensor histidine kinase [Haliangium sp.]|uniref:sensor histidine kinase n=1 Tax=Haliangium sp. TaxID=2663208 RepID=UPI003D106DB9